MSGADQLWSALETLDLIAFTAGLADRERRARAFDHLAVSSHFAAEWVEGHQLEHEGEPLGDHAAYTAVVNVIAP